MLCAGIIIFSFIRVYVTVSLKKTHATEHWVVSSHGTTNKHTEERLAATELWVRRTI